MRNGASSIRLEHRRPSACRALSATMLGLLPAIAAVATGAGMASAAMAIAADVPAGAASAPNVPAGTAAATCVAHNGLPDKRCTPGALNSAVTQATIGKTICVKGWTDTVRPSSSVTRRIKIEREIAYGIPAPHPKPFAQEELDHLIPLELGGAPEAIKDLWPEPRDGKLGYKRKDTLENRLKRLVCAHSLSLKVAQKAIAVNWEAAYRKYIGAIP